MATRPNLWKKLLPLLASAALVAFIIWNVSPTALLRALGELNWAVLLPLTFAFLFAAYLWDSFTLLVLFRENGDRLRYRDVLRARGMSYAMSVVNFGLGQGHLAWLIARAQNQSVLTTLARCFMLIYIDLYVLLSLALAGSMLSEHPRAWGIAVFCGGGLLGLVSVTLFAYSLPEALVERLRQTAWGRWLPMRTWRWKRFGELVLLRTGYFGLDMVYVAVGLWLIGVHVDLMLALSAVPVVALVDGLPITVSGLGTREATLLILLDPDQRALVLAFCLTWTACTMITRGLIGAVHLWMAGHSRSRVSPEPAPVAGRVVYEHEP